MFYLKCSKCGRYNEIKTEYQTFCTYCNKKLDNSFSDWKILNPEGSFYDFKQKVCVSEVENEQDVILKKRKSNLNKSKKGIAIGAAIIFSLLIYYLSIKIENTTVNKYLKEVSDQKVIDMAKQINTSCPVMIDDKTRLDSVSALPNNIFQCNYTLTTVMKDSLIIDDAIDIITPSVRNYVKTNPDLTPLRENKTTVNFSYNDKNGVFLFVISITPDKYEQ